MGGTSLGWGGHWGTVWDREGQCGILGDSVGTLGDSVGHWRDGRGNFKDSGEESMGWVRTVWDT